MANFINAADRVIMPIAIIQMSTEFKYDLHVQGWILSAFAIGYMSSMVSKQFKLCIDYVDRPISTQFQLCIDYVDRPMS